MPSMKQKALRSLYWCYSEGIWCNLVSFLSYIKLKQQLPLYLTVVLQYSKKFEKNASQEATLLVRKFYYLHVKYVFCSWSKLYICDSQVLLK